MATEKQIASAGNKANTGGYKRLPAIEGWVYTRSCRAGSNDVLFHVPFIR